jgi:hypothetical protein
MTSSYKQRTFEKSRSTDSDVAESDNYLPNRRMYSYRDHEEVYDSAPRDGKHLHSRSDLPKSRKSSRHSRSGSSTSRISSNRTSSQTILDTEETSSRPRHSLRITLAGAIAGGLIGRQLSKGDTLTSLTAAALGAFSVREVHSRKHKHN